MGALGKVTRLGRELITDPRASYYYVQKGIRSIALRETIARSVSRMLPRPAELPGADPVAAAEVVSQLEGPGYAMLPSLSAAQVSDVRRYFEGCEVRDWNSPTKSYALKSLPPEIRKARFDLEAVLKAPHLLELTNHPLILTAVSRILGCKPTVTTMQAWWSLAGKGTLEPANIYQDDMFHRDVDDYVFIKLFVYLTDVDAEAGPHVFIRGSQRSGRLVARKPLTDAEVAEAFPASDTVTFLAPAGTCFLENTWGIHRATPPSRKDRLIFSVNYGLTALNAQAPRRPAHVDLGARGPFDPYINRVCLGQPAGRLLK